MSRAWGRLVIASPHSFKNATIFFSAGHHHYTQYTTYYLNDMKNLPPKISAGFMRGEHMTQHVKGYWKSIWSDMFIETTFTQYGKGPNGLIGFIFKPRSVKIWVYSLIACRISQLTRSWKHARKTEGPKKAS